MNIPTISKGLLYPVKRIPYARIVLAADGYEYYMTTFYNIPAIFKCRILIINGLRIVDDEFTCLRYVILGSASTSDLTVGQFYTDASGSNVILNPNTNLYQKISYDGDGNMIFTNYTVSIFSLVTLV